MTRLLIVEDNMEFLRVALGIATEMGMETITASSLEEALPLIDKADAVVTDLFFPCQQQVKELYTKLGEALGVDPNEQRGVRRPGIPRLEYGKDGCFAALREEPAGLLVARKAQKENIPVIIMSQGNNHYGDLGAVRYQLFEIARADDPNGLRGKSDLMLGDSWLAFTNISYSADGFGYKVDKSNPAQWQNVFQKVLESRH